MSQFISLAEGIQMTTKFRSLREQVLDQSYRNKNILPICETFDKATIEKLLSHSGCQKLRIYYGMDENDKVHAIVVAVDGEDHDILPPATLNEEEEEDEEYLAERAIRCPYTCPPSSDLNP